MKQQRVELHQHLLPQQQLQHPIGDRRRRRRPPTRATRRRAASARLAVDALDRRRARALLRRQLQSCVASASRSRTDDPCPRPRDRRARARRPPGGRARTAARAPPRAAPRRRAAGSCGDAPAVSSERRLQPLEHGRRDQHVAGPRRQPARATSAIRARVDAGRVEADARQQRADRQARGARVVHHHRRSARRSASSRSSLGRRIEVESAAALERRRGPNRRRAAGADRGRGRRRSCSGGEYARRMKRSPRVSDRRPLEPQPDERARPGRERRHAPAVRRPDDRDAPEHLGRALVEPHARAVLQRPRVGQHLDDRVGQRASRRTRRASTSDSPRSISSTSTPPRLTAARCPATAASARRAVHLHAAHLHRPARPGRSASSSSTRDAARHQRAGDDGAEALHREHAIDRQPRRARRRPAAHARGRPPSSAARRSSSPAPVRADTGTIGAPSRNEPATSSRTSSRDELERVGVDQVGLGQRDEAGRHPEQPADVEVLARLRHHRLVGRDDEHDEVDAADAGEHVLDEPLVPGHVDERDVDVVRCRGGRTRGRS